MWGGSNEYPQSMFLCKNKKNKSIPGFPAYPPFYFVKVGFKGVFIAQICFPDVHKFCPSRMGWHKIYIIEKYKVPQEVYILRKV